MAETTILLIRHGQSEGNILGLFTGHSGYSLSKLGHKQAEMTAEYIRARYNVDAVYCSDLPRAFQTAEHIAKAYDLPVITDARLREINAGRWENKAFTELPDLFPEAFTVWREDLIHARCTGGESVLEVADRSTNCLQTIAATNPGKCIAIVAHATTIRASLWKISGATEDAMQSLCWGGNCGISVLCFSDGELQIHSQNITEHLSDLVTELPENL